MSQIKSTYMPMNLTKFKEASENEENNALQLDSLESSIHQMYTSREERQIERLSNTRSKIEAEPRSFLLWGDCGNYWALLLQHALINVPFKYHITIVLHWMAMHALYNCCPTSIIGKHGCGLGPKNTNSTFASINNKKKKKKH